jgi:hypothetical protein
VLFCAWLAWSRYRVVVPLWDNNLPSVVMGLDLGAPELAGTLVNPKGYTKKAVARVAGGEIAGFVGSSAATLLSRDRRVADVPDFGRVGNLAVSADDVALIKTKFGWKMTPTDTTLARAPRSQLSAAELDEGRMVSHLTLRASPTVSSGSSTSPGPTRKPHGRSSQRSTARQART